jgi:dTDP-4-amino-4,6-dideoxygalactose transaminase
MSFVFHLYVVRSQRRDALRERLAKLGIAAQVHYPIPAHRQPAFAEAGGAQQLAVTERFCQEVLSLPMYPSLSNAEVDEVIDAVRTALRDVEA